MTSSAAPDAAGDSVGNPIVVVGCGYRCGSTLLQRILCGAPRTMVWGESNDALPRVLDAYARVGFWQGMSLRQKHGFETEGPGAWIANLQPSLERTSDATAAWIRARYDRLVDGTPAERWGMKELGLGPTHMSTLWTALPAARVLFMLRHPRPMLASMTGTGWFKAQTPAQILDTWIERVAWAHRSTDPRLLVVRYEALCAEPSTALAAVADHLGMPRSALDAAVLGTVQRGTPEAPSLEEAGERALDDARLKALMAEVGYAP